MGKEMVTNKVKNTKKCTKKMRNDPESTDVVQNPWKKAENIKRREKMREKARKPGTGQGMS